MPEEAEIPLDDLQDKIKEKAQEGDEEGGGPGLKSRRRFVTLLAATTAMFAVLAAIAALASGNYANEALFKANEAVLSQNRASDTYAEYQADGIKALEYTTQATVLRAQNAPGSAAQDAANNAKRESDKRPPLLVSARNLEKEAGTREKESTEQLGHHHRFAFSVTLFQVAIGLAALAALVNLQPLWWLSILGGLGGILLLIYGFMPVHEAEPKTGPEPTPSSTPSVFRLTEPGAAPFVARLRLPAHWPHAGNGSIA